MSNHVDVDAETCRTGRQIDDINNTTTIMGDKRNSRQLISSRERCDSRRTCDETPTSATNGDARSEHFVTTSLSTAARGFVITVTGRGL